ncbi:MAG: hypothetical protein ABEJ99_01840 [Candidatus Nanohaloarchaea archaeon]
MSYGKLAKGMSSEQAARKLQEVMMPVGERSKDFHGASPPSVFIGSHNYPKVSTGVLSPQHPGSSDLLDSPGQWYSENYSIEKVASLRTSLVNSRRTLKVRQADSFLNNAQEIAMARKPVDIEVSLRKKPGSGISAGRVKPVSVSGDIEKFIMGENPSVERQLEKAFYDTDLKADNAVRELYSKGVDNYKIQQTLSTGMLGEESNRKLVPTRWSITASDDIISKKLRDGVKQYQELGQIEYYRNSYVGNDFHIFLIPGRWEYELMELKRPSSVWNASANTYIAQNYEPFSGRTSYADQTAGAFYATRLAVTEYLNRRGRQAKVLVVREVKPEYWAPLGVWVIRETVRDAFNNGQELESFEQIKWNLSQNFRFLYKRIVNRSRMLGGRQFSLSDF